MGKFEGVTREILGHGEVSQVSIRLRFYCNSNTKSKFSESERRKRVPSKDPQLASDPASGLSFRMGLVVNVDQFFH